jgi:2-phospho-L-lactate guanylyltransferase
MAQVVIATRGGPGSKTRCAGVLSAADREALTEAMLEDMLAAIAGCREVSGTWVVTPTPNLAALAAARGALVVRQAEPAGLNAAFALAAAEVRERAPYDAVMLMPGDLPELRSSDLDAAVLLARAHAVVLAPALDGGTGLLGLRAGVVMAPEFGPDSFARQAASAVRQRLSLAIVAATSLRQDVDRPEDLVRVVEQGLGARTAALLRGRLGSAQFVEAPAEHLQHGGEILAAMAQPRQ